MRIHLIKEVTLRDYIRRNPQCVVSLQRWINNIKIVGWDEPEDIFDVFPTADLLGGGSSRVVFDIAGNRFRIICHYGFGETQVHLYVCWIGTHAEYTILCRNGEQYTVSKY